MTTRELTDDRVTNDRVGLDANIETGVVSFHRLWRLIATPPRRPLVTWTSLPPDRLQGNGKKRPIAGSVQRVAARQPEATPGDLRQPETARLATICGLVIMTAASMGTTEGRHP